MRLVAIGENTKSVKKWNPKIEAPDDEFVYIDIASVSQERKQVNGVSRLLGSDAPSRARQLVRAGDVVVSTVRPNLNAVACIPKELDGATASTGFSVLRCDPAQLDPRYLYHWVRSQEFIASMVKKATGQSYPAVSDKIVKSSQIPLPPLSEQKRMAAILDQADALCSLRQNAIDRLKRLDQEIFFEMFGDPVRNSLGWPTRKLGEIVKIRRGGSPRPIEKYLGGTIPWIKIGDATRGDEFYIKSTSEKIHESGLKKTVYLKRGSLIFANCGVSLGFARILDIDGCIHDGWLSIEEIPEDKVSKIYLLKLINFATLHFRRIAPSGTQPNLNTKIMKNFDLMLPPMDLQQAFEDRLKVSDEISGNFVASDTSMDQFFRSIQFKAFRGEL